MERCHLFMYYLLRYRLLFCYFFLHVSAIFWTFSGLFGILCKNRKSCVMYHKSHVMCHMSCITCHISCVTCHMSHVICHLPPVSNANSHSHSPSLLTLPLFTADWFKIPPSKKINDGRKRC